MSMAIYLPFPNNLELNMEVLDDKSLVKQTKDIILIFEEILKYKQEKSYLDAPVVEIYKDDLNFVATYGLVCINEYKYRFGKVLSGGGGILDYCNSHGITEEVQCSFVPCYLSKGHKAKKDGCDLLFQGELVEKWVTAKKEPKWTKRDVPEFFQRYVNADRDVQEMYWRVNLKMRGEGK
jgi:hypothetical protein